MLSNKQTKQKMATLLGAMAVLVWAGMATAQESYHLVRFPEFRNACAISDSGVIVVGNYVDNMQVNMLLEPARDADGNPIWDSDGDGIADGYAVTPMNPGVYQDIGSRSINESLDVVGYGSDQDGKWVALLWLNAPAGNPPVELGKSFNADQVWATSINELGQVLVAEYASDHSDPDPSHWLFTWALTLANPKDTNGDGVPDLWNEDLNGDGFNDLMVNIEFITSGPPGGSLCYGRINNYGQVAGVLSESIGLGLVILPEDTDGDGAPDLWFKDIDGDGWNDLATHLGPDFHRVTLSDSGVVVGTAGVWGEENHSYRWQIDESGNVDLVAMEVGPYNMKGVNNMGRAVGFTETHRGNHHPYTTYLWEPDLTIINLYDLLDNPSRTEKSLRCLDINNAGFILGGVYDNYPEDLDVFVAVPIVQSPPGNQFPVADAGADQTVIDDDGNGDELMTLDGSASFDPDGIIIGYEWKSGENVLGTDAVIDVIFPVGEWPIILTVTDNEGATDSDEVIITVAEDVPFINAPSNLAASVSGDTVTLTWLDNSDNEDGFFIERRPKNSSVYEIISIPPLPPNTTSFVDSGLSKGRYYYRVQAFNTDTVSDYSNVAGVNIK